jgi:hypothetical protein
VSTADVSTTAPAAAKSATEPTAPAVKSATSATAMSTSAVRGESIGGKRQAAERENCGQCKD